MYDGYPRNGMVGGFFGFWFLVLATPRHLSCPTRDQTCAPCGGVQNLNYWITREVLGWYLEMGAFGRLELGLDGVMRVGSPPIMGLVSL